MVQKKQYYLFGNNIGNGIILEKDIVESRSRMFELKELQTMVNGAYRKLKSYYYYDKTLLYIKKSLAQFEAGKGFQECLQEIGLNLYLENQAYFDALVERIDFRVMSKKLKVNKPEDITQKDIDHAKSIYTLNFYIDAPVELLIVDCLFMLFVGKVKCDLYGESECSYAGRFVRDVFRKKEQSLERGIDYASNRCFEPYYVSYEAWKNKAVDAVGEYKDKTDIVLMSLDFKSFYYSVNFDFSKLERMLKGDKRLQQIRFLTGIIEKVYQKYTGIVGKYRDCKQESENTCMLPIGLLSPLVLRNLYMMRFDSNIQEGLKPIYYGRYVDDLLLVLDSKGIANRTVDACIRNYLICSKLFRKSMRNRITYAKDASLSIQIDKVRCYYFKMGSKDRLLKGFYDHIGSTVSEANLVPDIDMFGHALVKEAYSVGGAGVEEMMEDPKLSKSSYYNVVRYINGLKFTLKNVYSGQEEVLKCLDEIMDLYRGSSTIEFFGSWRTVFELFVLVQDVGKFHQFYETIERYIEGLEFKELKAGEIYRKKYKYILFKLKKSLLENLNIACALALGLDYGMWKQEGKIYELAKLFRRVNLINHDMVFLPLVNYTNSSLLKEESLVRYRPFKNYTLSQRKIDWSPRFIQLEEYYLWHFMSYYHNQERREINYQEVYQQFLEDNAISGGQINPILSEECIKNVFHSIGKNKELWIKTIEVKEKHLSKIRIGIVNTSIVEEEALKALKEPTMACSYKKKAKLFKLLNMAAEEAVDYLVFPEFYMPFLWIYDLFIYAKQVGVTIITGMQYMTYGNRAYNFTCIIARVRGKQNQKESILLFREKNFYAPDERFELAKRGFVTKDQEVPFYYVVKSDAVTFSTVLCFEFTDIFSRAILKPAVNVLFIPQLNKDTHYFASVVEATARDLHAFVIQSNTAKYGDSRITLPAKTAYREIAQVKGGLNDVILVNEVNLEEFITFQKEYPNNLERIIETCLVCTHEKSCEQCEVTATSYKHYKYKGLPPNY